MKLLCIGGTRFSGRALTLQALQAGHEVTVFHRGPTGHELEAEHVLGDRATDLHRLGTRRFDAVVDFCGFLPAQVRAAAERLADSGWYGFVSSISAHPLDVPPGTNEDGPVFEPPFPDTDQITGETYGPLKVACERVVREVFGDRAAVVRPGFIVGPHDPTDRFPSLVRRAAAGGEMLAPGPADGPLQFVDARDLGAFLLHLATSAVSGTFGAVHPRRTATTADVLAAARDAAGADTTFTWPSPEWLVDALEEPERERAFPMWGPEYPGLHQIDARRAAAAGLQCRPIAETVRDTLAWERQAGRPPQHGLAAEQERALLARWRQAAQNGSS